ncbi:hypothetical protein Tco_1111782 [Tanacetum coccineum]|uniref:Uncharacterized protein n=1 Tax=Tanacetum coccineum TaxID=301880 RepID=A0ABQ5IMZ6_9ASTR
MLQNGTEFSTVDVNHVSIQSWYVVMRHWFVKTYVAMKQKKSWPLMLIVWRYSLRLKLLNLNWYPDNFGLDAVLTKLASQQHVYELAPLLSDIGILIYKH